MGRVCVLGDNKNNHRIVEKPLMMCRVEPVVLSGKCSFKKLLYSQTILDKMNAGIFFVQGIN